MPFKIQRTQLQTKLLKISEFGLKMSCCTYNPNQLLLVIINFLDNFFCFYF